MEGFQSQPYSDIRQSGNNRKAPLSNSKLSRRITKLNYNPKG